METWMRKILEAQRLVEGTNPNSMYEDYKWYENWYWYWIPLWMYYDSNNDTKDLNILDIGCGCGTLSALASIEYKNPKITAMDIEKIISDDLLNERKIDFINGDIENYDFGGFKTDRIIFTEILEHLTMCPITVLRKLNNILNDKGLIFLSTPDVSSWGRLTDYYSHIGEMPTTQPDRSNFPANLDHVYQYSEGELLYIFDRAGFNVVENKAATSPFWGAHLNFLLEKRDEY